LTLVSLSAAVSCKKSDPEELENSSILLYVAGNNSLSYYSYDLISQLSRGEYLPPKNSNDNMVLLYSHSASKKPILCKITRNWNGTGLDTTILRVYESSVNSASPEQLHQVLTDAQRLCPAKHRGLVLWSHGTGYLPEGYTKMPDKKTSFGADNNASNAEIEIQELAAALPETFEYIMFDACLMGTIEVAYELKDVCNYLLFSPTEIMAQGFPYYMMMDKLFNGENQEEALKAIAAEYYDYYIKKYEQTKYSSKPAGGTVTLVKTDKLKALADTCKPLFEKYRTDILNLNPSGVQGYYQYGWHWFYDLGDIVEQVASADEYSSFKIALKNAIVYSAATPKFQTITIKKYSGLSTYLPDPDNTKLNAYYKDLKWNQATYFISNLPTQ